MNGTELVIFPHQENTNHNYRKTQQEIIENGYMYLLLDNLLDNYYFYPTIGKENKLKIYLGMVRYVNSPDGGAGSFNPSYSRGEGVTSIDYLDVEVTPTIHKDLFTKLFPRVTLWGKSNGGNLFARVEVLPDNVATGYSPKLSEEIYRQTLEAIKRESYLNIEYWKLRPEFLAAVERDGYKGIKNGGFYRRQFSEKGKRDFLEYKYLIEGRNPYGNGFVDYVKSSFDSVNRGSRSIGTGEPFHTLSANPRPKMYPYEETPKYFDWKTK